MVESPIPTLRDITQNFSIGVRFKDPEFDPGHVFKAVMLPGAKIPGKVLKPEDFNSSGRQPWRPQLGFNPNRQQAHLGQSGHRALNHSLGRGGGGQYSNTPPPGNYQNYRGPQQHYPPARQNSLLGAPPFQQQFHRPSHRGGAHVWDPANQNQHNAFQQNSMRGRSAGGYQHQQTQQHQQPQHQQTQLQTYQQQHQHQQQPPYNQHQRRDERGARGAAGGQGYNSGRGGYPAPPPSRRYNWN